MSKRSRMSNFFGRSSLAVPALLVLSATASFAQLKPGQFPAGPPPQPGQLGPAPKKPQSPAATSDATKTDGGNNEESVPGGPTFGTSVRYVLVPTTLLVPHG